MNHYLLDCERMKYEHTGLFHYCLNLGQHLQQQLTPQKEDLSFFLPRTSQRYFGDQAAYVHQYSVRKYLMPRLSHYDLYHATFQDTRYLPIRNRAIQVALTIHDLNFLYEKQKGPKRDIYLQRLQKNIDRSAAIICISHYVMNDVKTHLHIKRNQQLHVIYNGANALTAPALALESFKPERPFIFTIGLVNKKKNFHVLLPLIHLLKEQDLVIAGRLDDHDYVQALYQEADRLGIAHRIHLIGSISEAEKSWYYHHCEAFAFTSLAEGFGLPVIEAMSIGKPVFLSTATALPEIGGALAFYFEDFLPEHMKAVYESGLKTFHETHMKAAVIAHSQQFSWHRAAQQYLDIYRGLLNK